MPEAWDIVCMTDSHRIMELGALWCQAPVSGNVAHCSIPCRVFYWVSGASLAQPKQAAFHSPTPTHAATVLPHSVQCSVNYMRHSTLHRMIGLVLDDFCLTLG